MKTLTFIILLTFSTLFLFGQNQYFPGNVGIGINTSTAKLDVTQASGGFSIIGGADILNDLRTTSTRKLFRFGMPHFDTAEEPFALFTGDSNGTDNFLYIGGGTSVGNAATQILFRTSENGTTTDGTTRMTISRNGHIGIGTTTPLARLSVASGGSAPTTPNLLNSITIGTGNANAGNKYLGQLGFVAADVDFTAPKMVAYISAEATELYSGDNSTGSLMRFYTGTNNAVSPVERMVINNLGYVGLGTPSPSTALDVVGSPGKQLRLTTTLADLTAKNGYIATRHYNNAEEDFLALLIQSNATANIVTLGGGSSTLNTATELRFNTAATTATLTGSTKMVITSDGRVGIGTVTPAEELSVNGNIRSKQVKVDVANWPDYVFKLGYELVPLATVKAFIDKNGHLPEVPSAAEIAQDGLNVGEMNKLLVKKIEELTLHLIEKDEKIKELDGKLGAQQQQIDAILKQISK